MTHYELQQKRVDNLWMELAKLMDNYNSARSSIEAAISREQALLHELNNSRSYGSEE
jgi:hypothetical protein